MKTRNIFAKKIELFHNDINKKRDAKMRLQTDQNLNK